MAKDLLQPEPPHPSVHHLRSYIRTREDALSQSPPLQPNDGPNTPPEGSSRRGSLNEYTSALESPGGGSAGGGSTGGGISPGSTRELFLRYASGASFVSGIHDVRDVQQANQHLDFGEFMRFARDQNLHPDPLPVAKLREIFTQSCVSARTREYYQSGHSSAPMGHRVALSFEEFCVALQACTTEAAGLREEAAHRYAEQRPVSRRPTTPPDSFGGGGSSSALIHEANRELEETRERIARLEEDTRRRHPAVYDQTVNARRTTSPGAYRRGSGTGSTPPSSRGGTPPRGREGTTMEQASRWDAGLRQSSSRGSTPPKTSRGGTTQKSSRGPLDVGRKARTPPSPCLSLSPGSG